MDFRQLNAFLTIGKLQSFTAAANDLGYAQSTITTQIKLLEQELGVKLFERIGKHVTLTHEGILITFFTLLQLAKQMIKLSDDIKNVVFNEEKPSGTLTIGAAESLCVIRLPEILKEYRKLYPDVEVSLKFGSCADFRQYLKDNIIDVAFSLGRKIDSEDFISQVEFDEENNLNVYITLFVKPETVIKDLASNVQKEVKTAVKNSIDIEPKSVNIRVRNIVNKKDTEIKAEEK